MSGEFVLDTNIVIAFLDGETVAKDRLLDADAVIIPAVVIGELFHGAYRTTRREKNIERVEYFASAHTIATVDVEVAQFYGRIKSELRRIGTPIPENDVWIAAVAMRSGMTLVTRDEHFGAVAGLKI